MMLMLILQFILLGTIISVYTKNELTAIIMPFHRRQIKKLMFNFGTWNIFEPSTKLSPSRPELILFASGVDVNNFNQTISEFFNENLHLKEHFSTISVQFGNLTVKKDGYWRGTKLMFEAVLNNKLVFKAPKISHIFYMEPDCVPIRKHWIDALINEIENEADDLIWMKGSKFVGNPHLLTVGNEALKQHLNGNSIYNVGSDDFRKFYYKYIKPNYVELAPYDLRIFEILLQDDGKLYKEFGHHFIPTKFVQNTAGKFLHWDDYIKEEPTVYLIHLSNNWRDYLLFYNENVKPSQQVDVDKIFAIK